MANPYLTRTSPEERARLAILRHPDKPAHRIADCIRGASAKMVREIKAQMENGPTAGPLPVQRESSGLVSLESLKAKFDTAGAIRRELEKLPRGKLILDRDLRQIVAGYDSARFKQAVENNDDEFKPYRIRVKSKDDHDAKWYWGHPEDVAELQKAVLS